MRILMLSIILASLILAGCGESDSSPTMTTDTPANIEMTPPSASALSLSDIPQLDALIKDTWILKDVRDNFGEWEFKGETRIDLKFSITGGQNRIRGNSGCNSYNGIFGIDGNVMFTDNIASTKKACAGQEVMQQETEYLSAIETANSINFTDDENSLVITYGLAVPSYLTFEAEPPAPTPPTPIATPVVVPTPQVLPGTIMVNVFIGLQKPGTVARKCEIPVDIGFYPPGLDSANLMDSALALFYFSGTSVCTSTANGTRAMVTVGPVNPGTYDITADSPTTLLNVKRGVYIE